MRMNLLLLLFTLQGFNLLHAQSNPGSTPAPVQTSEEILKVYPCVIRTAHPRWNH